MAQLTIRSYKPSDATSLATIARRAGFSVPQTAVSLHRQLTNIPEMGGRVWVGVLNGQPLGYATVLPLPGLPHLLELDGFIAPSQQRQGHGSALLAAVLAAVAGSNQTLTYAVDSHDEPAALFLRHHQFVVEHEERQMVWTVDKTWREKTAVLPPHLSLRTLPRQPAIHQFIALYDRSFAPHPWYQPFTPDEVLATLTAASDLHFLYANDPIGFVWLRFDGDEAEIEPIGIVPEAQGLGNGRLLLTATLAHLAQCNCQAVRLGVWQTNQPARQLYESMGFVHHSSRYFYGRSL
jgi:mycothiol synthase